MDTGKRSEEQRNRFSRNAFPKQTKQFRAIPNPCAAIPGWRGSCGVQESRYSCIRENLHFREVSPSLFLFQGFCFPLWVCPYKAALLLVQELPGASDLFPGLFSRLGVPLGLKTWEKVTPKGRIPFLADARGAGSSSSLLHCKVMDLLSLPRTGGGNPRDFHPE